MTDKLTFQFDFPGTEDGERAVRMLNSLQSTLNSSRGSGKSLEELRRIMVGMKGQASVFEDIRNSIRGMSTSLEQLNKTVSNSMRELGPTLRQELREVTRAFQTAGVESGRSFTVGIEKSMDAAEATVVARGKSMAAKAKAEATRAYEAMVANQPNAKIKDMSLLAEAKAAGATLSPQHAAVLKTWEASSRETLNARRKIIKAEGTELKKIIAAENNDLQAWFAAAEKQKAEIFKATKARYSASLTQGSLNVNRVKNELEAEAKAVKGAYTKHLQEMRAIVAAATNEAASIGATYQKYNPRTQTAGAIVNKVKTDSVTAAVNTMPKKIQPAPKEVMDLSNAFDKLTLSGNNAHSMARGLASGFNLLWLTWGNLVPLFAGAAISNGLMQTAKYGMEVAHTLKIIESLGENSAQAMSNLTDELVRLGREGPFGPREVAEAMKTLTLAGLSGNEVAAVTRDVLNFAVAGTTSIQTAADVLVSVTTAFKMGSAGFREASDVIAKAAAMSKTDVDSFGNAMKTASVISEQYGVSLKDTAIGIAALSQLGIEGTSAGTALRNMFADLSGRSGQVAKALRTMNIELRDTSTGGFKDLITVVGELDAKLRTLDPISAKNYMQAILSERGAKGIIELLALIRTKSIETGKSFSSVLEQMRAELDDSAGFSTLKAAELAQTVDSQFKTVGSTFRTTMLEVYKQIEPTLYIIAKQMQATFASSEFLQGFSTLISLVANLASTLARIVNFVTENYIAVGLLTAAYTLGRKAILSKAVALQASAAAMAADTVATNANTLAKQRNAAATGAGVGALGTMARILPGVGTAVMLAAGAWSLYDMFMGKSKDTAEEYDKLYNTSILKRLDDEIARLERLNALRLTGLTYAEAMLQIQGEEETRQGVEPASLKFKQAQNELAAVQSQINELRQRWRKGLDVLDTKNISTNDPRRKQHEKAVESLYKPQLEALIAKKTQQELKFLTEQGNLAEAQERIAARVEKLQAGRRMEDQFRANSTQKQLEEHKKLFGTGSYALGQDAGGGGTRTPRLATFRDQELRFSDERLQSEQTNLKKVYDMRMRELKRSQESMLLTEAEYYSQSEALTQEYEANSISTYMNAISKREAAQKQSLDIMVKDNAGVLGANQQSELAILRQSQSEIDVVLAERQQIYQDYWNNLSDPDALETFQNALAKNEDSFTSIIDTMKQFRQGLPDGPMKELSQKFIEAAQSALTFRDKTNTAITGVKVEAVNRIADAISDLQKRIAELKRKSDEFWSDRAEQVAYRKEVEALNDIVRYGSDSMFNMDSAYVEQRKAVLEVNRESAKAMLEYAKALDVARNAYYNYLEANKRAIERNDPQAVQTATELGQIYAKAYGVFDTQRRNWDAEAARAGAEAYEREMTARLRNIHKALAGVIETAIFEGGEEGAKALRKLLEEELLRKPFRIVIEAVVKGLMDNLGISDIISGGIFNASSWVKAAGWFTDFSGSVAGSVDKMGATLLDWAVSLNAPNSPLATAGEWLVQNANAIGQGVTALGYVMNGINTIAAINSGQWGAAAGTAVGSYFFGPLGGTIGGYLGGMVDRGFGGGYERTTDVGITGRFSGTGFSGRRYQDWYNAGGWFSGSSSGTNYSALAKETQDAFGSVFAGIKVGTVALAAQIGATNIEMITEFQKDVRLSLMGSAEQNKAAIDNMFKGIAEEMAGLVVDKRYRKQDETAVEALNRLVTSLGTVNLTLERLGSTTMALSVANANAASLVIDSFGGAEQYSSAVGSYYNTFYTEEERSAQTLKELNAQFNAMNMVVPRTREEYRDLVNAQDLTTESGRRRFKALIDMSDEFATTVDETGNVVTDSLRKIKDAVTALDNLASSITTARANVASAQQQLSPAPVMTLAQIQAAMPVVDNSVLTGAAAQLGAERTALDAAKAQYDYTLTRRNEHETAATYWTNRTQEILADAETKRQELVAVANSYTLPIHLWGTYMGQTGPVLRLRAGNGQDAYTYNNQTNFLNDFSYIEHPDSSQGRDLVNNLRANPRYIELTATLEQARTDLYYAMQAASVRTQLAEVYTAELTTEAEAVRAQELVTELAAARYANAVSEWTEEASKSVPILEKLKDETLRYYEAQKALADAMAQSATSLREAVTNARDAQMSAEDLTSKRAQDFQTYYSMALATSEYAKIGYADKMTNLLPDLVAGLKDTAMTEVDWKLATAPLYVQAESIAAQLEASAPQNYQADSLNMLNMIDASLAILDDSTRAITRAISETGSVTAEGLRQVVTALGGTPAFATGGYHTGGLRIVGENGPELEMTGPSRILNHNQLQSMMRPNSDSNTNAALVAEVRQLREDNRAQARSLAQLQQRMVKVLERWDGNGIPEERVVT